jgi:hypothetical protein
MIDLFATVMLRLHHSPLAIRDRLVGKSTVMHVPQIVCVCHSTVNMPKCKQQATELLLHMITIKFWKFDEYGFTGDSLLNSWLYRHFEYSLHEIFISWLHNYLLQSYHIIKLVKFSRWGCMWEGEGEQLPLPTSTLCIALFYILSAIIISDELFQLSHVIIQFLSRKYKMWIKFFRRYMYASRTYFCLCCHIVSIQMNLSYPIWINMR